MPIGGVPLFRVDYFEPKSLAKSDKMAKTYIDRERVEELWNKGDTAGDIALEMDIAQKTVDQIKKELDLKNEGKHKRNKKLLETLINDDEDVSKISNLLDLKENIIRRRKRILSKGKGFQKIDEEKLKKLFEKGYGDNEMAEIFDCYPQAIRRKRMKLGLKRKNSKNRKIKSIDRERVKELHKKGCTDSEIARKMGHSQTGIRKVRMGLNLKNNYPNNRDDRIRNLSSKNEKKVAKLLKKHKQRKNDIVLHPSRFIDFGKEYNLDKDKFKEIWEEFLEPDEKDIEEHKTYIEDNWNDKRHTNKRRKEGQKT